MCMRIRLNNDKVIVGQGSGCSVPRGDVKENKKQYDNVYMYIQTLREVQGISFEIGSWVSMETITREQCESGCLKCGVVWYFLC